MLFYWLPSARLHPTNIMHQIPVDTIIVYIQTHTTAIITLKSITFSIVLGGVLLFFLCFFLFCREDYNGITTFTELLSFTGKICLYFINKELYFFSQLLMHYVLHGLIYSFLSIWDFKNKWEMC